MVTLPGVLPRKTPGIIVNLTPASGRQDHTTSPYASLAVRPRASSTRRRDPRPPHPAPTFVTMANAPLSGTGRTAKATDLPPASSLISENQKRNASALSPPPCGCSDRRDGGRVFG